MLVLLLNTNIV